MHLLSFVIFIFIKQSAHFSMLRIFFNSNLIIYLLKILIQYGLKYTHRHMEDYLIF
jgi:hypothetical protein